jgi:transposase-like protein
MTAIDTRDASNSPDATRPKQCPSCRSQDLTTTGKVVNADSYWRCCACGEVWNVGRQRTASRYVPQRYGR